VLMSPAVARAQAVPDSARVQVVPDSAATSEPSTAPSDAKIPVRVRRTVSKEDSTRRHVWHEAPRWVMARSVILPGWGQAHNGAWYKAAAVATGEIWLGTKLVQDQRELNRLSQELADADAANDEVRYDELVNQYNARLEQRTARQWLFGALLAYAMIDAYVDAHFRGFEIEFQTDPALPAGPEPASGGQGGAGARLALRWTF
jgi:hypothetical protein